MADITSQQLTGIVNQSTSNITAINTLLKDGTIPENHVALRDSYNEVRNAAATVRRALINLRGLTQNLQDQIAAL